MRNIIESIGSPDHVPFNEAGLPGFNVIKDFSAYDERTRHTNADYPERMTEDALKQSAIVMATFAWQAAMLGGTIPRMKAKWGGLGSGASDHEPPSSSWCCGIPRRAVDGLRKFRADLANGNTATVTGS